MQAIVLVGGLGTRLRSVLPDLPKPMAPITDKPFLAYLLQYLHSQGITRVIFPVCYLAETIQAYFQAHYAGLDIQYVLEEKPLGTGGAIVNALSVIDKSQPVFVLNGDTFAQVNYRAMHHQHLTDKAGLTMALCHVGDCSRYGKVVTDQQVITQFNEKGEYGSGMINAGVYLMNPDLFSVFDLPRQFSFETDFLLPNVAHIQPQAFIANDYFIDIGIPEDYARAQIVMPAMFLVS